jgi:two-component system nitrate/nitrite response regulator NarL
MLRRRLLLIDDHTLFRTGLRLVLADLPVVGDILEAGSVMEAVEKFGETAIDMILLDIQLPGVNGLDGVKILQRRFVNAHILIVSGSTEQSAAQISQIPGVFGFLPKTANAREIEEAIRHCVENKPYFPQPAALPESARQGSQLTPRQLEVLSHLCHGKSNKVIAHHMGLSENTVRVHVAAILDQLGVDSRVEAVLRAQQLGLINTK